MPKPYPGLLDPPVPGVVIVVGPFQFFAPPMVLRDMQQCVQEGVLKTIFDYKVDGNDGTIEPEGFKTYIDALVTVLYRSLKRNYPELEQGVIEKHLDVVTGSHVVRNVMNVNAMIKEYPPWTEPAPTTPLPTPETPPVAADSAS